MYPTRAIPLLPHESWLLWRPRYDVCTSLLPAHRNSTQQKTVKPSKASSDTVLAMCYENEPELWASPTDPRYRVGTLEQRLDILVKPIQPWYWNLNT